MTEIKPATTSLSPSSATASRPPGLAWTVLATIAFSFATGFIASSILRNASSGSSETFSTSELISFLFGIALSSASMVLAIAAINLGKLSERAMIQRSDESIRLQNDVFARTTDALQRIESSTGVTERRIEDIISGRAGAISDRIVDRLASARALSPRRRRVLEKDVRESVLQELSKAKVSEDSAADTEERKRIAEAEAKYDLFNKAVLLGISNLPDTRTLKIGEGTFDSTGEELFDGIFEVGERKFGVCTFSTSELLSPRFGPEEDFRRFTYAVAAELASNHLDRVLYIFDAPLAEDSVFSSAVNALRALVRPELAARLVVLGGAEPEVVSVAQQHLRDLAAAA